MIYPYSAWAEQNLRVTNRSGAEWTVFCPNPNHLSKNPHCSFNVNLGVYFCFSCGAKGSLRNDAEMQEGDFQMQILKARMEQMLDDTEIVATQTPESMLDRYRVPHPFWQSRGVDKSTQKLFDLGYDLIADAATIPLRTSEGALTGVTRRFRDPEVIGTKYKYPRGFKAAQNVFGSWLSESYDVSTVVKTEGAIDAMRLWQLGYPAVAFYGNGVSPDHVRILLEMGVHKVIDFSDNDEGGSKARERSFGYWQNNHSNYYYKSDTDMHRLFQMMTVKQFFGKKDAGSMSDEQIVNAVESSEYYRIKKFVRRNKPKTNRRSRDVLQGV